MIPSASGENIKKKFAIVRDDLPTATEESPLALALRYKGCNFLSMGIPHNSTTAPEKVAPVDEFGMTDEDHARVLRACDWVRVTTALLPYLRDFLVARLGYYHYAILSAKIARMNGKQIFRLWEHIKDEQSAPSAYRDPTSAHALSQMKEQSPR